MIYKDVTVDISKLTAMAQAPDSGFMLFMHASGDMPYSEYSDMAAVAAGGYAAGSPAYKAAAAYFGQSPKPPKIAIAGASAADAMAAALDVVMQEHPDFGFLATAAATDEHMLALCQWAAANKKIYAGTIAPSAIGSAAAPASDYALYLVHDAKEQYPEAALIGKMLGWRPGEATWMFKRLDGISPVHFNDQAASVELINSKHYMTYVSKHGLNVTTGGYVTSGEYADVVLGVQWMQSSMELRIFNLLASSPKVPYDNGGIALIAAQVDAALKEATRAGVIRRMGGGMGDYAVSIPNVEDIDPADIAGRVLRDITFSATLAGAVHGAKIRGTVQYASVLGAAA